MTIGTEWYEPIQIPAEAWSDLRPATLSERILRRAMNHFREMLRTPIDPVRRGSISIPQSPAFNQIMRAYDSVPSSFVPIVKNKPKVWKQKEFNFE